MGIYSNLESKWYSILETIDQVVPVTKITDKIDNKVPSFLVFLLILIIIILFFALPIFTSFGSTNTLQVTVTSSTGLPLSNAKIEITDSGNEIKEYFTGDDGKVEIIVFGEEFIVTVSKPKYSTITKDATIGDKLSFKLGVIPNTPDDVYSTVLVYDIDNQFIENSILEVSCDGVIETLTPSNSKFYFKRENCLITQVTAKASGYSTESITLPRETERKTITLSKTVREGSLAVHTKNFGLVEPNVEIIITNVDGKSRTLFTDASGEGFTKLAVGTYTFIANSRGGITNGEFEITDSMIHDEFIIFQMAELNESKYLALNMNDSTGQNIQSAEVTFYKNGDQLATRRTNALGKTSPIKINTDNNDQSNFSAVIKAMQYETKFVTLALQEKDSYQEVTMSSGGATLNIRLINDLDLAEKEAFTKLELNAFNGILDKGFSDVNGNIIFKHLPAGNYTISAFDKEMMDTVSTNLSLTQNETKSITLKLMTGEGRISFEIKNNEMKKVDVNYQLYSGGNLILFGTTSRGKVTTPNLKVGSKVELKVVDTQYIPHKTINYSINRTTQKKELFVRKASELPNNYEVQMFLMNIYDTNPLTSSYHRVNKILPDKTYYLYFDVVVNNQTNDGLLAGFIAGINDLIAQKGLSIEEVFSINNSHGFMSSQKEDFIDLASTDLVNQNAKEANIIFNQTSGLSSIPIILVVKSDLNAEGTHTLFFRSQNGAHSSLEYSQEFTIGETFCITGPSDCPSFLFSSYLKWEDHSPTPIGEDPELILIEDDYSVFTTVKNITDEDFGSVLLNAFIPKEKLNYLTINDTNSQSHSITLSPLETSQSKEFKINPLKITSSSVMYESVMKNVNELDVLRDYKDNEARLRFTIKNKEQLHIAVSPNYLENNSEYPLFIIKTKYNSKYTGVSAHWRAEKVVEGENLLITDGITDENGLEKINFSTLNFLVGDKILFTAWDNNGAHDGTVELTITNPFPDPPPIVPECLSVLISGVEMNESNSVKTLNAYSTTSFSIDSNCDVDRDVIINSLLPITPNHNITLTPGEKKQLTITAKPDNNVLGIYPVKLISDNETRVITLGTIDIIIKDPNSCFDLEQAIFDLRTIGKLSSKVTNKCFDGRYNNFYPKLSVNTGSVSTQFNKPGNPQYIDFNATVVGSALEGYFQSTLGTTQLYLSAKEECPSDWEQFGDYIGNYSSGGLDYLIYDNAAHSESAGDIVATKIAGSSASTIECQEVHEGVAKKHYYNGELVPKPEPDLNINNPSVPLGRMPIPSDWTNAPSMDSYGITKGGSQKATNDGTTYNKTYPYTPVTGEFGQVGGVSTTAILPTIYDFDASSNNTTTDSKGELGQIFLSGNNAYFFGWPIFFYDNAEAEGRSASGRVIPAENLYAPGTTLKGQYYTVNGKTYNNASPERWYLDSPPWMSLEEEGSDCYKVISVENGAHRTVSFEEYKYLGKGNSYLKFYLRGNRSWNWGNCSENKAHLKLQFEATRGGELLFERKAIWQEEIKLSTIENAVQEIGSYSAVPVPKLMDIKATSDGYGPWTGYAFDYSHYFTGAAHPNGFVNLERSISMNGTGTFGCVLGDTNCEQNIDWYVFVDTCENGNEHVCLFQKYVIRPPEDPLVEYDPSGSIMYYIPQDTIPGFVEGNSQVRTFLKDGKYYAEYVGAPEIASNQIDFNITKNNLLGEEYATLTVSDWINDDEIGTQEFNIKLTGNPHACYANDGTEGFTGETFVPKLLFNWDWTNISLNQCDSTNWDHTYCDATQFTISLFKKLNEIENLIKINDTTILPEKTTFYSYLIKDNYSKEFLDDYKTHYSSQFLNAGTTFDKLQKFIVDDKLKFETRLADDTISTNTLIPYGGLYRVEINIDMINKNLYSLFNGEDPNANITIRLAPINKAPNYNPFYELPFNGSVNNSDNRNGYGVSITGNDLELNTSANSTEYPGALRNITHDSISTLDDLDKGTVLIFDNNDDRLITMPSQPTPVAMIVSSSTGDVDAEYKLKGTGSTDSLMQNWNLTESTIGGASCYDFENQDQKTFIEQLSANSIHTLSWNGTKGGTLALKTVFLTPKDVKETLRITPTNENIVQLKSYDTLTKAGTVFLDNYDAKGIDNYSTLKGFFERIENEQMCMSKDSKELMKIWWNQKYLDQLKDEIDTSSSVGGVC